MKLSKDAREGLSMIGAGACILAVLFTMAIVIQVLIGDASPHGVWAWIVNLAVFGGTFAALHHLVGRNSKPKE